MKQKGNSSVLHALLTEQLIPALQGSHAQGQGMCSPAKGSGVVDELQSRVLSPWLEAQPTAGVVTSCCHRQVQRPK